MSWNSAFTVSCKYISILNILVYDISLRIKRFMSRKSAFTASCSADSHTYPHQHPHPHLAVIRDEVALQGRELPLAAGFPIVSGSLRICGIKLLVYDVGEVQVCVY